MNLEKLKIFKLRTVELIKNNQQISIIIFIALFIIYGQLSDSNQDKSQSKSDSPELGIDTYIPKGYTLIPIEIENKEQLSSLLEQKGIVDLYSVSSDHNKKSNLVARSIRLLRAPKNPEVFAVLVKESQISQVMSFKGPFRAVIQSANQKAQEIVSENSQKFKIEYQN